jgi:signal transduction histidine kinase
LKKGSLFRNTEVSDGDFTISSGNYSLQSINMNAATQIPHPGVSGEENRPRANTQTAFSAIFEHSPIAAARCNGGGVIVEVNSAFERVLDRAVTPRRGLRLHDLLFPQEYEKTESLLRDLFNREQDCVTVEVGDWLDGQSRPKWTIWRQPCAREADNAQPEDALIVAGVENVPIPSVETCLQTLRWEAIGRLTGGVVHDFNNLLTGVMLYCDLLLSSLDGRDRRRRYADEIRNAIVQSAGLVQQLLVFARPQSTPVRALSFNQIAQGMQDLLTRLIGENIALELRLDPELGLVKIDQAHAQQILLNLILNARDALPEGGRITLETRNCHFQPVFHETKQSVPQFPCVLLAVADNGRGMNAETRRRLFEPFFTTKNAGQGTGLGLTTVRSIVTTNRGLIHFESEPGRGTCAMVLLPRAPQPVTTDFLETVSPDSPALPLTPFQDTKKEPLL